MHRPAAFVAILHLLSLDSGIAAVISEVDIAAVLQRKAFLPPDLCTLAGCMCAAVAMHGYKERVEFAAGLLPVQTAGIPLSALGV